MGVHPSSFGEFYCGTKLVCHGVYDNQVLKVEVEIELMLSEL